MKNKILFLSVITLTVFVSVITGCTKKTENEPLEPISIVSPDSSIVYRFPADSVPMEFKFTTDRPINWILGKYDIDTLQAAGYVATYPDTLFFEDLTTLTPRVNRYDYKVTYNVPDPLRAFSHIRFKIWFEAGTSTFTTGQNYPAGKVSSSKEFRVDVR